MWPHEIQALYRWYCTLPATVVILGTIVAVIRARASYKANQVVGLRDLRFRFDENDVAVLGPLFWLFGFVVVRSLSWLVGGFSNEGKFTAFYVFYGTAGLGTMACLCVVFFYRQFMPAIDIGWRTWSPLGQRISEFYRCHSSRWYFILPLAMTAFAILAIEKSFDLAYLYKWYYVSAATVFFFVFLAFHTLGAIDYYADEHADYHGRRAETLSKLLTLVSLFVILWMSALKVSQIDLPPLAQYAVITLYGAAIWVVCALLTTWLAVLLLSTVYGLGWVKIRKLSSQLVWAAPQQKSTVCYRIRKVGGDSARTTLVRTLHDPSMHIAARIAAARELAEMAWQPDNAIDQVWLAVGADDWDTLTTMDPEDSGALLEILDETLYRPENTFDGNQLALVTIPIIKTLGSMADASAVKSLTRAVRLANRRCIDNSPLLARQSSRESDYSAEVIRTRCEAAHALRAIGPPAATCIPVLREILTEESLDDEVAEAVTLALRAIRPS